MDTYTVSFFGHRRIDDPLTVDRTLEALIRRLLFEKSYVEFLLGRDGDFDQLVSSAIHRAKRTVRDDNSSLVWVLPYATAEYRNHAESYQEYYDEVEISEAAAGAITRQPFRQGTGVWLTTPILLCFTLTTIPGVPIRQCAMPKTRAFHVSIYVTNEWRTQNEKVYSVRNGRSGCHVFYNPCPCLYP